MTVNAAPFLGRGLLLPGWNSGSIGNEAARSGVFDLTSGPHGGRSLMAFIQIIEVTTTRMEEIQALMDEWLSKTEGKRKAGRSVLTADRDRPNSYLQIVEFPSYEEAMANSQMAETDEFAKRLVTLCDAPPSFRNLDVTRVDDMD
jgi:hypothetical protein